MHTLRTQDRDRSMDATVSFHDVPMFRGTAFAIRHIERHGAKVAVYSGNRVDSVIEEHNRQFGTNLHGQQWLIKAHLRDPQNYAGANLVNRTSHCGFADSVISSLLRQHGVKINPGDVLPWWAWGIDLDDVGKNEDVSDFMAEAHHLGYHFAQPYTSGSERHHVIQVASPIPVLERWQVISKNRRA